MFNCGHCGKDTDERQTANFQDLVVCFDCEEKLAGDLESELEEVLENFYSLDTGGGCRALGESVFVGGIKYEVILTDISGSDIPSVEDGLLIGYYEGEGWHEGKNPLFIYEYKDNLNEGIERIRKLSTKILEGEFNV
jgi:hypothetical protein